MTVYAEIKGETLIQFPYTEGSLQAENPYTNFGLNPDLAVVFPTTTTAIENGYTLAPVVYLQQPPYDKNHQSCTQNTEPTFVDGVWVLGWTVTDFSPEQQQEYNDQQKADNKQQASALLSATDWTAIPSIADPAQSNPYLANQAEFLAYRSQIRAIAVNPPVVVDPWPTVPVEVWETVPTA